MTHVNNYDNSYLPAPGIQIGMLKLFTKGQKISLDKISQI